MFTKLKTYKAYSPETINLEELVQLVRHNPNKDKIEYLRSIEYKSKEYNNIKGKLPCILPVGIFTSLLNDGLISMSGYLYYDIDGLDTTKSPDDTINDTIKKLNDTLPISFICKSCGGKGISFLVKVPNLNKDNFFDIRSYIFMLIENIMGLKLDNAAGGISRKMIISSDDRCIYNKEVSFDYEKVSSDAKLVSFQTWISEMNQGMVGLNKIEKEREVDYTPDDTFKTEIIPYNELINSISLEIPYTKEIDGDFIIDEVDSYKILIPNGIKDGDKHRVYIRLINALCFINKDITFTQVYSFIYYVNKKQIQSMSIPSLLQFTRSMFITIKRNGPSLKTRKKKIHFNKDIKINGKERNKMAAKISASLRTNKTIDRIQKAIEELAYQNIIPTQKKVCELTGLGIATVKRNWTKQKKDIKEIKIDIKVESKIEKDLDYIDFDEFFSEKEEINYKGIRKVLIDKITQDDKKYFIEKMNDLIKDGIQPQESIVVGMNLFSEEKSWYLYDKWRSKYGYPDEYKKNEEIF